MDKSKLVIVVLTILILVWVFMFVSIMDTKHESDKSFDGALQVKDERTADSEKVIRGLKVTYDPSARLPEINRYDIEATEMPPAPLAEIERNMTVYLHTLHSRLGALAGPNVDSLEVWETFLEVTRNLPMTWDEQNRFRFPKPRKDNSIFVSLGTYRDPYCPMTIKSLYKNAKHADNVYVGLFQQNCFGPRCRTGVLVGGRVDDAGPDPDCYQLFCESEEGINSNACKNGHVRLYNVNESESLGPYMARYLGLP